jgi:hypothetical protein
MFTESDACLVQNVILILPAKALHWCTLSEKVNIPLPKSPRYRLATHAQSMNHKEYHWFGIVWERWNHFLIQTTRMRTNGRT